MQTLVSKSAKRQQPTSARRTKVDVESIPWLTTPVQASTPKTCRCAYVQISNDTAEVAASDGSPRMLKATDDEIESVREYFEWQAPDLEVTFMQKVYSEAVLNTARSCFRRAGLALISGWHTHRS